jgi:hypothetical protein
VVRKEKEERVKLGEVTIDTSARSNKISFPLERTPDSYCDRRWRETVWVRRLWREDNCRHKGRRVGQGRGHVFRVGYVVLGSWDCGTRQHQESRHD